MCGLSLVAVNRSYSSLQYTDFSLGWLLLFQSTGLGSWASVVVVHMLSSCGLHALELGLNSCGVQALVSCSMWNLHGPGIEPMSPALAGGFLSTVPPGKSKTSYHE